MKPSLRIGPTLRSWIRPSAMITVTGLVLWSPASIARAQHYPEASLDQATIKTINLLKIRRYAGLDEEGIQAEYEWALDMAGLCMDQPNALCARYQWWSYAVEFQRHAGRTARYRGFGEQAIQDYETAIEYVYEVAHSFPEDFVDAQGWEDNILQDIADTYLIMGAYEPASELSNLLLQREQLRGATEDSTQVDRLAKIAQQRGRFAESVRLQQENIRKLLKRIAGYLERFPESNEVEPSQSWAAAVRSPDIRRAIHDADPAHDVDSTAMRQGYYRLGRALRLNGQLDEAAYALKTAELTPWHNRGAYRENLDFYVDREWAALAFVRGDAAEAIRLGNDCLSKYAASINPSERVELLDLVSRALEQQGDLQGALDKLKTAIEKVEKNRANLTEDENKRVFVAQYADLYRRACELVLKMGEATSPEKPASPTLGEDGAPALSIPHPSPAAKNGARANPSLAPIGEDGASADAGRFDRRTIEESFEWSERAKARAMLDTLRRLDRRMALAVQRGDPAAIRQTRDLAGVVVSVPQLRQAPWWDEGTALLEYMASPRGVWLWVVTADGAQVHRISASGQEIDDRADALRRALLPGSPQDQSWIEPAAWLYGKLIQPADGQLRAITHLVVVGDGILREIPFEVFVDQVEESDRSHRFLLERYTISYAPSATVAAMIADRGRRRDWAFDFWGFASTRFRSAGDETEGVTHTPPTRGDATSASSVGVILRSARSLDLGPLPYASKEVERIAMRFPEDRRRVYVDYHNGDETAKQVLTTASASGELGSVRFLHFATHAILDADRPTRSGLVMCPPYPDAPTQSTHETPTKRNRADGDGNNRGGVTRPAAGAPVAGAQGSVTRRSSQGGRPAILSLSEIASLELGSEVVVLSACHTLSGQPVDGDWLNGLARSVFVAGGDNVVCTLWQVSDRSALMLMPGFYRKVFSPSSGGFGPAGALREAKLALLRSPMFRHPSNWAAFVCHGGLAPAD